MVVALTLFATAFSPHVTLTYQYLIPALGEDEEELYSKWERISALATIAGGMIAYLCLELHKPGWLLVANVFSFLISGPIVWHLWNPRQEEIHGQAPEKRRFKCANVVFFNRNVLFAAAGMWMFSLTVHGIANNTSTIGIRLVGLPGSTLALAGILGAGAAWIGGRLYDRIPRDFRARHSAMQVMTLLAAAVGISLIGCAGYWGTAAPGVAGFIVLNFLEPIWSVTNTMHLRAHVEASTYGEVFGLIRMPRSLLTMMGTTAVGWSVDNNAFPLLAVVLIAGLVVFVAGGHKLRC